MAPLVLALKAEPWVRSTVLLSGQHRQLLDQALQPFGIVADQDLDLMRADQRLGELTGRAFIAFETALDELKPDMVLAQGDTTTVMTASVSSFYRGVPFGHVEAGLRTGDIRFPFPEELNRIIAGVVASLHFAPTSQAAEALTKSGVKVENVIVSGNTVIDALQLVQHRTPEPLVRLRPDEKLILLTAHRRENFGAPIAAVFDTLRALLNERPALHLLYPVHPNPNVREVAFRTFEDCPRAHLVEPLGYLEFVSAMKAADVILTDSGGVQEEAPALAKPVLVLRDETERPEAVHCGVAKLVGTSPARIRSELCALLDDPAAYAAMATGSSPYGDGFASERIVQSIATFFGQKRQLRVPSFGPS